MDPSFRLTNYMDYSCQRIYAYLNLLLTSIICLSVISNYGGFIALHDDCSIQLLNYLHNVCLKNADRL